MSATKHIVKSKREQTTKYSYSFAVTKINPVTNTLEIDLYCKPTDSHNYLLYNSAHSKKCKESIPYSQFLRIRRICTNIEDYDRHIVMLSKHFLRRGYPLKLLENAAITAKRLDRNTLLANVNKTEKGSDDAILITTYDPAQDILKNITKENWDYLGKSPMTTHIYQKKSWLDIGDQKTSVTCW